MNTQEKTYTKDQHILIAELSTFYGLQPEQIMFFTGDPQPFFDRDATAVLIHKLTGAIGIEDDIVASPLGDAIAVKYKITFEDGSFASSTGIANVHETGSDDKPLTFEQLQSLATSRASRSALRNKGIDLMKLHRTVQHGNVAEFSGPPERSNRARLIAQAHVLGKEVGLINEYWEPEATTPTVDKTLWYRLLMKRYSVSSSGNLSELDLADFVAFLNSLVPQTRQKAA